MAVNHLTRELSDLCLGKPALRPLSPTATVADAVTLLKISGEPFISVWDCHHSSRETDGRRDPAGHRFRCRCIGKLSMVDVICFLCKDENLISPSALLVPVSQILPKVPGLVAHLESSSSLSEAIDLMLEGTQNIIVPIKTRPSRRKLLQKPSNTLHNGREYCWLTQEDIIRFFLSSIGLFSPVAGVSIASLGIVNPNFFAVDYHSPAISAIGAISESLRAQTSVAVVDGDGILVGEISPDIIACSGETAVAAIGTLTAGDLMVYIDSGRPPENLVRLVKARLKEKNMEMVFDEFTTSSSSSSSSSCSSDEEFSGMVPPLMSSRRYKRSSNEAIVCHQKSSLVAVMIQAIAHRVKYVWVAEDDGELAGIVTFSDMLKVIKDHLDHY